MSRPKGAKNKKKRETIKKREPVFYGSVKELLGSGGISSSLRIGAKTFHATGSSVEEAIKNLNPEVTKGMSILTIKKDSVVIEKILGRLLTTRLFGSSSPFSKEVALRQAITLFGEL